MTLSTSSFSVSSAAEADCNFAEIDPSGYSRDHDQIMTDILDLYFDELSAYAMTMCRNPDLSGDIVQQTCLKAWQARKSYETDRPAKPWLFRIMRNEYFQFLRKKSYVTNVDESVLEPTPDCAEVAHRELDVLSLYDKLSQLPEDQRSAITLVIAMGLTYDEAGKATDSPAGTVKSRVNRARRKLRVAMS